MLFLEMKEKYFTRTEDKQGIHGPRKKRSTSLTRDKGDNKRSATIKSDKRVGEEDPENTEAKISPA